MNAPLPTVTVVIAARPGQAEINAVTAAQQLDYPKDKLEIIVARGKQPAIQRNRAIQAAKGELIFFLDDDSMPPKGALRQGAAHFTQATVQMVGGPNVCPPESPELEHAFALTMGSWLAFGPSRARYTPVGVVRDTSEKELILCNLLARRSGLLEAGGFDESLYPNEENALMDNLQARGGRLLYDPAFFVYRRPRQNLKAFAKMLMTYGRGRAEQFRRHPTPGSAMNFVPPLFVIYVLSLLAGPLLPSWYFVPLAVYLIAVIVQASLIRNCVFMMSRLVPLIILSHLGYGTGFWKGLFTTFKSPAEQAAVNVSLEVVQPL